MDLVVGGTFQVSGLNSQFNPFVTKKEETFFVLLVAKTVWIQKNIFLFLYYKITPLNWLMIIKKRFTIEYIKNCYFRLNLKVLQVYMVLMHD